MDTLPSYYIIEVLDEATELPEEPAELVNTDQIVRQALHTARTDLNEVGLELRPSDIAEKRLVDNFLSSGCQCTKAHGGCSSHFSAKYVTETRASFAEMSRQDLDMVLLGQLLAFTSISAYTYTSHHLPAGERSKCYTHFFHQGQPICSKMFHFLHGVGTTRVKNIKKNLMLNGPTPRTHGNQRRRPHHALSLETIEHVLKFLYNHAEQNGLLLPGRVPGYSRSDIKLLPSSKSKRAIWHLYKAAAESEAVEVCVRSVAYTTFCQLWRTLAPSIIVMKPMTDLCWQCQQNSTAIMRSANCPESEKSDLIRAAEEHLHDVHVERTFYTTVCKECQESVKAHFTTNGGSFEPPPLSSDIPPNSTPIKAHYSFDYAQQVHFPHDPLQPGPIYFLTPRKCTVFGVNCEAIPRQVNFLTDESGEVGKGANAVISRLHYFFEHHGLGEKQVYLHADNCTGQNKNNALLQYLLWRVLTGQHSEITYSFLVVGHTKFSPDFCFGLFKRLFKRTKVDCMADIAKVVEDSAACNSAQLVYTEDGTSIVPMRDWVSYLAPHFKRVANIKKFHHFHMSAVSPGVITLKTHADSKEQSLSVLRDGWTPSHLELPPRLVPKGLTEERQWYLFDQIRQFCSTNKDVTCPRPLTPRPKRQRTPFSDN